MGEDRRQLEHASICMHSFEKQFNILKKVMLFMENFVPFVEELFYVYAVWSF